MAEPKKMEPGRTKIGTITAKDENEMVKEYTICFGNIAFPQKNGKFMHLRNERYREILSNFWIPMKDLITSLPQKKRSKRQGSPY